MRVSVRSMIVGVALAAMGGVLPLHGQAVHTATDTLMVFAPADMGKTFRLVTAGSWVEGTLLGAQVGRMHLDTPSGERWLDVAPGDSLWVLGNPKRRGALIGGAVGLGLTAGVCIETFDECGLEVGIGVLTPFFALMGAGIGSLMDPWRLVFP